MQSPEKNTKQTNIGYEGIPSPLSADTEPHPVEERPESLDPAEPTPDNLPPEMPEDDNLNRDKKLAEIHAEIGQLTEQTPGLHPEADKTDAATETTPDEERNAFFGRMGETLAVIYDDPTLTREQKLNIIDREVFGEGRTPEEPTASIFEKPIGNARGVAVAGPEPVWIHDRPKPKRGLRSLMRRLRRK